MDTLTRPFPRNRHRLEAHFEARAPARFADSEAYVCGVHPSTLFVSYVERGMAANVLARFRTTDGAVDFVHTPSRIVLPVIGDEVRLIDVHIDTRQSRLSVFRHDTDDALAHVVLPSHALEPTRAQVVPHAEALLLTGPAPDGSERFLLCPLGAGESGIGSHTGTHPDRFYTDQDAVYAMIRQDGGTSGVYRFRGMAVPEWLYSIDTGIAPLFEFATWTRGATVYGAHAYWSEGTMRCRIRYSRARDHASDADIHDLSWPAPAARTLAVWIRAGTLCVAWTDDRATRCAYLPLQVDPPIRGLRTATVVDPDQDRAFATLPLDDDVVMPLGPGTALAIPRTIDVGYAYRVHGNIPGELCARYGGTMRTDRAGHVSVEWDVPDGHDCRRIRLDTTPPIAHSPGPVTTRTFEPGGTFILSENYRYAMAPDAVGNMGLVEFLLYTPGAFPDTMTEVELADVGEAIVRYCRDHGAGDDRCVCVDNSAMLADVFGTADGEDLRAIRNLAICFHERCAKQRGEDTIFARYLAMQECPDSYTLCIPSLSAGSVQGSAIHVVNNCGGVSPGPHQGTDTTDLTPVYVGLAIMSVVLVGLLVVRLRRR